MLNCKEIIRQMRVFLSEHISFLKNLEGFFFFFNKEYSEFVAVPFVSSI